MELEIISVDYAWYYDILSFLITVNVVFILALLLTFLLRLRSKVRGNLQLFEKQNRVYFISGMALLLLSIAASITVICFHELDVSRSIADLRGSTKEHPASYFLGWHKMSSVLVWRVFSAITSSSLLLILSNIGFLKKKKPCS